MAHGCTPGAFFAGGALIIAAEYVASQFAPDIVRKLRGDGTATRPGSACHAVPERCSAW